jgi:hypothetical protein
MSALPTWWRALVAALVGAIIYSAPLYAQTFGNINSPTLINLVAAAAGTTDSADQVNYYGRGLQLGINISAKTGTIAVTVAVQGKDVASGTYYPICTSASLTSTGFVLMTVFPGTTPATNTVCNVPLPAIWRVEVVNGVGVTPATTMTVGASVIM